jgi:hypothetical protein
LDREGLSAIDHGFLHPYDQQKTPCLTGSAKEPGTNFSDKIIDIIKAGNNRKAYAISIIPSQNSAAFYRKQLLIRLLVA